MFCTNCGHQVSENAAFCTHCGAKLKVPVNHAVNERVSDTEIAFPTIDDRETSKTNDQTGQISDGVFPAGDEKLEVSEQEDGFLLFQEFEKYKGDFIARLKNPSSGVTECAKIFEELQDPDKQGIMRVVDELNGVGKFDDKKADEYIELCYGLANKFFDINADRQAMEVLDYARIFGPGDELEEKLHNLEKRIKNRPAAPPQPTPTPSVPPAPPVPPATSVPPAPPQSAPKPTPSGSGNNKKLMMIGAAAAIVIAAGGFFILKGSGSKDPAPVNPPVRNVAENKEKTVPMPTEEKVEISFEVPEGTKVLLDGKDVGSGQNLQVVVGPHDVQLVHPLLEFGYDKKLTVAKAGKISPVKTTQLGPDAKNVAEKTSVTMMNEILQQACNSDAIKLNPSVFTSKADANGKITKAHQAMRSYATKNSLKNLPVSLVSLGNLTLINSDRGIKCQAEFSGQGANGRTITYTAQTILEIKGDRLLVDSLESFKAQ